MRKEKIGFWKLSFFFRFFYKKNINNPNLEQNNEHKNNKYFPTQSKKDKDNVDDKI
jgi:hypothetical protein